MDADWVQILGVGIGTGVAGVATTVAAFKGAFGRRSKDDDDAPTRRAREYSPPPPRETGPSRSTAAFQSTNHELARIWEQTSKLQESMQSVQNELVRQGHAQELRDKDLHATLKTLASALDQNTAMGRELRTVVERNSAVNSQLLSVLEHFAAIPKVQHDSNTPPVVSVGNHR